MITVESKHYVTGRYKAVVHTGDGVPILESGWGKNLILNDGLNALMQNDSLIVWMVCGAGNTQVQPTDNLLASYLGRASSNISQTNSYNSTPDANGFVWKKTVYRYQFGPGTLGGGSVNVSEAGMAYGTSTPTNLTPLLSRGLLVDDLGSPTTVSVNNADEYLDILWEHTEWIPAETTSTVSLTIDGVATDHTITIRPGNFNPQTGSNWKFPQTNRVHGFSEPSVKMPSGGDQFAVTALYPGNISDLTTFPAGYVHGVGYSVNKTVDAFVTGSKQRTFKVTWPPSFGNISGGAQSMFLASSSPSYRGFQIGFSPKLMKTDTKQLDLIFRFAMDNKP